MKHLLPLLLLAVTASLQANDFASSIMGDNTTFYREHTDRIIRNFLERGTYPNSDDIARLQTLENHFLSTVRLDPASRNRIPTLLLTSVKVKDLRNLPGQFIVERAKGAGLDLRADRLQGRSFKQIAPLIK